MENSKSNLFARKVNFCFDLVLKNFLEQFLLVSLNLRKAALQNIQQKSLKSEIKAEKINPVSNTKAGLYSTQKQKPKQISILLKIAIYLTPIFLVFQLGSLCSLLLSGKYTPGFIFLITALVFLGCISTKIFFHDAITVQKKKEVRRKSVEKRKRE